MFQTRLIFEENDKEEYFNFFSQTNIDIFTDLQIRQQELFFNVNARRERKKEVIT